MIIYTDTIIITLNLFYINTTHRLESKLANTNIYSVILYKNFMSYTKQTLIINLTMSQMVFQVFQI